MQTLKHKFGASALYQLPQESIKGFLSRRWSFWLALFSCMAFLVGNMVGQHGWSAFWKSVWGAEVVAVYEGIVPPIAGLPGYDPYTDCRDIREYDRSTYSILYMGDYDSGGHGCGSHPGADILIQKGTPIYAIANGYITRKEERSWGFGNTIVLEFPGPDPDYGDQLTLFYAGYAHLGQILVEEGQMVSKGQLIAYSGQTGFATAAHLHFQIDRPEAPFHLYWPFTTTEATDAGLSFVDAVNSGLGREDAYRYTVDPIAYVQRYENDGSAPVYFALADTDDEELPSEISPSIESKKSIIERIHPNEVWKILQERSRARRAERLAQLSEREQREATRVVLSDSDFAEEPDSIQEERIEEVEVVQNEPSQPELMPVPEPEKLSPAHLPMLSEGEQNPEPEKHESHAEEFVDIPMPKAGSVAAFSILHDGAFEKDWEDIVIFARDASGNFVQNVKFEGELKLQSYYGQAEFSPAVLTEEQFDGRGRALVRMIPYGQKTIIPGIHGAFTAQGQPMMHAHTLSAKAARHADEG